MLQKPEDVAFYERDENNDRFDPGIKEKIHRPLSPVLPEIGHKILEQKQFLFLRIQLGKIGALGHDGVKTL